jgi:hypothetical protein
MAEVCNGLPLEIYRPANTVQFMTEGDDHVRVTYEHYTPSHETAERSIVIPKEQSVVIDVGDRITFFNCNQPDDYEWIDQDWLAEYPDGTGTVNQLRNGARLRVLDPERAHHHALYIDEAETALRAIAAHSAAATSDAAEEGSHLRRVAESTRNHLDAMASISFMPGEYPTTENRDAYFAEIDEQVQRVRELREDSFARIRSHFAAEDTSAPQQVSESQ